VGGVSVRTLWSFVCWPYNCASATSSFCTSQLRSCESDSPKILEKGDLRINCIQFNLGAIEIKSNGVIISSCQSCKRVHPFGGNGRVNKPRRHLPERIRLIFTNVRGEEIDISSNRHASGVVERGLEERYDRLARKEKPLATDALLIAALH
jgi:hypothetical protein